VILGQRALVLAVAAIVLLASGCGADADPPRDEEQVGHLGHLDGAHDEGQRSVGR
jgi:hypothetical protein